MNEQYERNNMTEPTQEQIDDFTRWYASEYYGADFEKEVPYQAGAVDASRYVQYKTSELQRKIDRLELTILLRDIRNGDRLAEFQAKEFMLISDKHKDGKWWVVGGYFSEGTWWQHIAQFDQQFHVWRDQNGRHYNPTHAAAIAAPPAKETNVVSGS